MFSYSFAVELVGYNTSNDQMLEIISHQDKKINVKSIDDSVILISSSGYACSEDAYIELASVMLSIKCLLLKSKIPHMDWISFNSTQKFATDAIGSIFEERDIVALSYKPQVYKTSSFQHWPGAAIAKEAFDINIIADLSHPEQNLVSASGKVFEALTILGLALADTHARSKLILSMTAIEVLIDRGDESDDMVSAINMLKGKIPELEIIPDIMNRLEIILDGAKKESISKAGKRLVRNFLGKKSAQRFYSLYNIRSEVVHGNEIRASTDLTQQNNIEELANEGFDLALQLTLKIATQEHKKQINSNP